VQAIVFSLRLNSLYSITLPFTWQSALTYPIMPPSAVIGLLANALQRYKNDRHPLEYLSRLEDEIIWAGSRLLSPCLIKSYTMSAITKWEEALGSKATNALGRQFGYTRLLELAAIFKNDPCLDDIVWALKTTPITCGDSESLATLEQPPRVCAVSEANGQEIVETRYPVPYSINTVVRGGDGQVFLMHSRCQKTDRNFPLESYLVPIKEQSRIIYPSVLKIGITPREGVLNIADTGSVITKINA
jgi:CRISPR-associated Cas5-like protein